MEARGLILIWLMLVAGPLRGAQPLQRVDGDSLAVTVVFDSDVYPYSSLRIPALVVSKKGTLLAFAAGRIDNGGDWADMDLVLRRSEDGGQTWEALQVVAKREGRVPTDNPTPIVGSDGTIHLIYQRDYARAFYIRSTDDGKTGVATFDRRLF